MKRTGKEEEGEEGEVGEEGEEDGVAGKRRRNLIDERIVLSRSARVFRVARKNRRNFARANPREVSRSVCAADRSAGALFFPYVDEI